MLTVKRTADDRLDIELTGTMDAEMMALALDDLIEKSEGIEHGKMLYSIPEFEMPTGAAIGIELTQINFRTHYSASVLKQYPRFNVIQ